MGSYGFQLLSIGLLIVLSAILSATETALLALGPHGVHKALDEDRRKSRLLSLWRENPNSVLTSLLIANNAINILASALATNTAAGVLEEMNVTGATGYGVAVAVGVMTFLIVLFGEVIPKTFAKHNAFAMISLFPVMTLFYRLVRPFSWALQRISGSLLRSAGWSTGEGVPSVTEAEIETLIRMGSAQGALTGEKQELLSSVIEFSETMTQEILVPRTDVVGFEIDESLTEVLRVVGESRFSRYPVYDEDLDSVIGILTVKDLLRFLAATPHDEQQQKFSLKKLAEQHKLLFVPETKKIRDLLKDFQRERVQMAVAVDEFGGTAGIVTTEDILEEIVGEIYDEHEKAEPPMKEIGPERYVIQGRVAIEELADLFRVDLPEQDIYETVGGLVLTEAGKVPHVGESVEHSGLRFEVRERTRTRVCTVLVTRVPPPVQGERDSYESDRRE